MVSAKINIPSTYGIEDNFFNRGCINSERNDVHRVFDEKNLKKNKGEQQTLVSICFVDEWTMSNLHLLK